jgi:hypothetical protein
MLFVSIHTCAYVHMCICAYPQFGGGSGGRERPRFGGVSGSAAESDSGLSGDDGGAGGGAGSSNAGGHSRKNSVPTSSEMGKLGKLLEMLTVERHKDRLYRVKVSFFCVCAVCLIVLLLCTHILILVLDGEDFGRFKARGQPHLITYITLITPTSLHAPRL